MPVDTPSQKVLDWQVSVNGEPLAGFRPNSYGEMEAIWVRHDRTDNAVIVAEGLVETQESHGVLGWLGCPVNPRYFLRDTRLTQASPDIRAMALALPDEDGPLARLHALSTAVRDAVAYREGVPSAEIGRAHVLTQGKNVERV